MNAELSKIRKNRNYGEIIIGNPVVIKTSRFTEMIKHLNRNMSELYFVSNPQDVDFELFINRLIENIYIILNAFNEMKVYPDYFYDEIFKLEMLYIKIIEGNKKVKENSYILNDLKIQVRSEIKIAVEDGLEKGYYRLQAYDKKDINDAFQMMLGLLKKFNIPCGIRTKENCLNTFKKIYNQHEGIILDMEKHDFEIEYDKTIIEEISYLSRLLFQYLYFFAVMGINPKAFLNNYIENIDNINSKSK